MVSSSCYDNFKLIIYLFQRVGDENLNHSSYNGELKLDITTKLRILASSERFNKTLLYHITYSNLFPLL